MVQFAGRCEALIKVPTGGASVSASLGSLASPVTVTVAAGSYFHTAAGGVSSLLTTLQTLLNSNVQGHPTTAAAMQAAVGYGTWTAGWLCNEASGNLAAAFGALTLTASSTPTYGTAGPQGGIDLAVGFDSASDAFDGGANFDPVGNDLVGACIFKFATSPAAPGTVVSKTAGGLATGWAIYADSSVIELAFNDGAIKTAAVSIAPFIGEWCVAMWCIERGSTNLARFAVRGLSSGTTSVSTSSAVAGNVTTASTFRLGTSAWLAASVCNLAGVWMGSGASAASGMAANLSTATTNFANAVNAAWTVSLDTTSTGRVTCANSFWPASVSWTNTSLRDVLGYAYDFDYPQTAAQVRTALGNLGDFTNGGGFLCNESSGNLSAIFGLPATLTAVSTPTYSNLGPRGGVDKAVGFDSATDAFSGGNIHNVGASDDLILIWVGKLGSATNIDVLGKYNSPGYAIFAETTSMRIRVSDGVNTVSAFVNAFPLADWHVGIAVVDRSTKKVHMAIRTLTGQVTTDSGEQDITAVGSMVNAINFRVGDQGLYGPAGGLQIAAAYVVAGPSVATGLSANLSAALSNFATYMKSQTSTQSARGVWFPGDALMVDDHPSMAPEDTDLRMSSSPIGLVLGLSGNKKYAHTNLRWRMSPVTQIREASAPYANGSLEVFFRDAISGLGAHPWMGPASPMQIYWSNAGTDALLGADANGGIGVTGWTVVGVNKFSDIAKPSQPGWVGAFDVTFPRVIGVGS